MSSSPARCAAVGIGANLGDARATVEEAVSALRASPGVAHLRASPLYRTAPVEAEGPDFINAVVVFETRDSARTWLQRLQALERAQGRQRPFRNAPRTLDLDLLLLGEEQCDEPGLTVPHPRMHLRAFVLRPLCDLLPAITIPGRGLARDWLARIHDQAVHQLAAGPALSSR